MKIVTLVGTRPELIKLSRTIAELDKHVEHILVHSGQNFDHELNQIFFEELSIRTPDVFLDAARPTAAEMIGAVIHKLDEALAKILPDALLCLGDTNSCLGVIAAKRRKIPIFHMEAGNRCYDQRVPEEINRRIVDHTSDVNLTYTEHARRALIAEGLRPDLVLKTGSPMAEVIEHHRAAFAQSRVLDRLGLEPGRYVVVSAHREENVDAPEKLATLLRSLEALAATFDIEVLFSTHPRTRQRLDKLGASTPNRVTFMKPLGLVDYVRLQMDAFCVVSDSGTITEEASLLGLRAVTIREAHERPEGMDEGTLVMTGFAEESLIRAVRVVVSQHETGMRPRRVADYDVERVSAKVIRIILSYTDYVNRTVWGQ